MRSWGLASKDGIRVLMTDKPVLFSALWGHSEKVGICKPGRALTRNLRLDLGLRNLQRWERAVSVFPAAQARTAFRSSGPSWRGPSLKWPLWCGHLRLQFRAALLSSHKEPGHKKYLTSLKNNVKMYRSKNFHHCIEAQLHLISYSQVYKLGFFSLWHLHNKSQGDGESN